MRFAVGLWALKATEVRLKGDKVRAKVKVQGLKRAREEGTRRMGPSQGRQLNQGCVDRAVQTNNVRTIAATIARAAKGVGEALARARDVRAARDDPPTDTDSYYSYSSSD